MAPSPAPTPEPTEGPTPAPTPAPTLAPDAFQATLSCNTTVDAFLAALATRLGIPVSQIAVTDTTAAAHGANTTTPNAGNASCYNVTFNIPNATARQQLETMPEEELEAIGATSLSSPADRTTPSPPSSLADVAKRNQTWLAVVLGLLGASCCCCVIIGAVCWRRKKQDEERTKMMPLNQNDYDPPAAMSPTGRGDPAGLHFDAEMRPMLPQRETPALVGMDAL